MKFRIFRLPYYVTVLFKLIKNISVDKLLSLLFRKTYVLRDGSYSFCFGPWTDLLELKEVLLDHEYETKNVHVTKADRITVDIGAGFGDFSIDVAKRNKNILVVSYEPDHKRMKLFIKNVSKNSVNNIVLRQEPAFSLQQIFGEIRSQSIDFLKIDCEGCEFRILDSTCIPYLKRVKKIALEYHTPDEKRVQKLLQIFKKAGFIYELVPQKNVPGIGHLFAWRKTSLRQ